MNYSQWLNCKKRSGGTLSFPFPLSLTSFPPLPHREAAPENQLGDLGSTVSSPIGGAGQSPGCKRILVYFELENRTWWQHFSYKRPKKKKQLYW